MSPKFPTKQIIALNFAETIFGSLLLGAITFIKSLLNILASYKAENKIKFC